MVESKYFMLNNIFGNRVFIREYEKKLLNQAGHG
jgi:hypothetical protein